MEENDIVASDGSNHWQILARIIPPAQRNSHPARRIRNSCVAKPTPPSAPPASRLRQFLGSIGPGVITGAADDDPAGIATYTSAGALLGTSMLWTALITWPLMGV